eukprot:CAMPEP_0203966542 /NCGR_PEP_ID=MMETSP0359-20131031/95746_1 /ASSEMBLY_ACC=CAM_ASM_000338 /TAXON_ID=268821 /ORGANISM="Scrippsiella Hangoei, Strain SHTV-5" /LENGTH=63 /DNA_ID=CAMNT_0050903961 /DNA_START=34 /DNA_END=222 /DNA_ORIENTATION=-
MASPPHRPRGRVVATVATATATVAAVGAVVPTGTFAAPQLSSARVGVPLELGQSGEAMSAAGR